MSYSYDLQAKAFDRMTLLKGGAQVQDPAALLNNPAPLRQLPLTNVDKVMALEHQVAADAPKVKFAEAVLNADATVLVGDAAKTLGQPVRKLRSALKEEYIKGKRRIVSDAVAAE